MVDHFPPLPDPGTLKRGAQGLGEIDGAILEWVPDLETGYVDIDPAPPVEKALELAKKLDEAKKYLERAKAGFELYDHLENIDQARADWMDDPEDIGRGVAFAKALADSLSTLKAFVPDALPPPMNTMITGPLEAVPVYVKVLGGHLASRIAAIDAKAAEAGGEVSYLSSKCQGGRIDERGVALIKGLPDSANKFQIFRTACHHGMTKALDLYIRDELPVG